VARHRILFFLAALWEIPRFIAAFNIATLIFAVNTSMVKALTIAWIGSPQLILAAGFLFGKFLETASLGFLLVFLQQRVVLESGFQAFFVTIAPYVIALADLILLIVLLLYRVDRLEPGSADSEEQ